MAPFNPPINPTNAKDYSFRSIDVPENIKPQGVAQNQINPQGVQQGDTSAQYAGQAAAAGLKAQGVEEERYADLFKNTVDTGSFLAKAGVYMVKKDIEDKVYQVADRERQSYTDLLEKIKAGTGVKNVLDANASMDDQEQTPQEIAALPDTLSTLQGARDSGKISGTYYQSKLLAEAKNLRAQYPGFREEIDQAFAKITGSNPANAYITSLVQDINRANAASTSNKNKTLTYIRNNLKFPGAEEMYRDYNAGLKDDNDVIKWAAPYEQQQYQLNMRSLKYNDQKNTIEEKNRQAGENIDYASGVVVNRTADAIMTKMGLNTVQDVDRLSTMQANGLIPATTWQEYGRMIGTAKTQLKVQMLADADRLGYTKAAGGKAEVIKRIDAALQPLDALADRVYNKDFGGIYDTGRTITAMNDDQKLKMLTNPKFGSILQTSQALKDIGGEQNLVSFTKELIKGSFPEDIKDYAKSINLNLATQYNLKTTGVPVTFNDAIDDIKQKKVNNIQFNNFILGQVNKITDPNTTEDIKLNYALAAFSPGNRGMISRLSDATGHDSIFQKFTSPEMSKAMFELGKKNPQIWQQYVDWTKETISNELMNRDINQLKAIPDNSGVKVSWDPQNHRFFTVDSMPENIRRASDQARGGSAVGQGNSYYNVVNAAVNRMNAQIYNFKRVAEASGDDVDSFVLKTIADSAGPEALRNVQGIPFKLIRDIGLSKMKKPNE